MFWQLSNYIFKLFLSCLDKLDRKRIIKDRIDNEEYLERYYLFLKNRTTFPFNIFLHKFLKSDDEEAVLEALLNADVDVSDIENEDGHITVFAPNTDYGLARQALCENFGDDKDEIDFETDVIQFLPQATITLSGDDVETFEKMLDLLNDLDDVQNVYHNVEG